MESNYDQIKPDHYKAGKGDVIDFCQRHELTFGGGSAVKYIARAGKKPGVPALVDLRKAAEFIQREIEFEESKQGDEPDIIKHSPAGLPTLK